MLVQILHREKIGVVAISALLGLECQAKCLMIEETGVPGENHRSTSSDTELPNIHEQYSNLTPLVMMSDSMHSVAAR